MHCPMLGMWWVFKKVGRPLASNISGQAQQNTSIGRGYAQMSWVAHPKMPLLELYDMQTQDRTYLCKRVTPEFLEFDDYFLGNLASLMKWWGKIASSCAMNSFKFVQRGHFQPGPAKKVRPWCTVFGVVLAIYGKTSPKSASFPLVQPRDANDIRPDGIPACQSASGSFSRLSWNPKEWCQCIELHFSFAVEWVGRCWAGLTNIADISYVSPKTTHDSCPLNR